MSHTACGSKVKTQPSRSDGVCTDIVSEMDEMRLAGAQTIASDRCNWLAENSYSWRMSTLPKTHSACGVNHDWFSCAMSLNCHQVIGHVTHVLTWWTKAGDVRQLPHHAITRTYDYTNNELLYEWCSPIEDPLGWSSTGQPRPTLATGVQHSRNFGGTEENYWFIQHYGLSV